MDQSKELEQFNEWVFLMDDVLEPFIKELSNKFSIKLDYSVSSLDILEQWLLGKYVSFSEILEKTEQNILDSSARYIGETFRKNIGGYWDIILDDKRNIYYNLPIITGYKEKPTPYCPLTLTTASIDRRLGNYLSSILKRGIERKQAL